MIRQCVLRSSLVCIFSAAAEAQTIPQLLISGNGNANPTVATVAIPPQYWQPDTRFQPMVKMSLSAKKNTAGAYIDGPVDAATAAFNLVSSQVNATPVPRMDSSNIAFVFYFRANDNPFFDVADKILSTPWPGGVGDDFRDPNIQPWMNAGVVRFRDWMRAFVTQYNTLVPGATDWSPWANQWCDERAPSAHDRPAPPVERPVAH